MMLNRVLCFFLFLSIGVLQAQDTRFSQFYAAPLHTNPGFTGATVEHRFSMNYRHQWPNIPGAFDAYHASYDYNAAQINSGFGLILNREDAGSFGLTTNSIAVSYAYRFRLNRKTYLSPGLKLGYVSRGIDFGKLIFNDQLESNSNATLDLDAFTNERVNYGDISTGLLLYSEDYWVGASANHINRANQSLVNEGVATIPIRYTFQAGYKFKLSGPTVKRLAAKDVTAAMHYEIQDRFDQLDLGAYYNHEPFVFGFWYRGIPLLKSYETGYANNDAMIILVGYSVPDRNFRIGYSYDVTISRLATNSGGAHEVSIVYEVASKRQKRR
ncbi:MAG: type IX secretion system membrane protein PorP/SprF, partial [Flavobacteriales bacterium]|nr:type IX secretion system membrane protein PorP/SprF [Flavobacteriales bacterium]